ncbi:LysM peptidoglycan-binding domain-containing M23 family metallopeptidase [Roseovarius nitratireducens]|uniref:LysM peptidoglycan-binding domain-containing M23 family metallopeptidase n=1 Tax=Roseovarius nitratireducens TaxID=2044597 RepID=UPI000CE22050|nr:LysM peptidoglycan-binding domain-containing M23 family metallopeptidase [Roseovarius nitratireducens]
MRHLPRQVVIGIGMAAGLAACSGPLDIDMRGGFGNAPSTAEAARTATATRPEPDSRGIISYPGYQVAVARRGDTLAALAARIGADADELARYNGIQTGDILRDGEIVALPRRVAEPEGGPIRPDTEIAALADRAIERADGDGIATSTLEPAAQSEAGQNGAQPIRHKVERGETAYSIARLYDVPVRSLADWNGLGPSFTVREGQFLLIPVPAPDARPRTRDAERTKQQQEDTVTAPGAGSPTPEPPSAAQPLPEEEPAAPEPVATPDLSQSQTDRNEARLARPLDGSIVRDYDKGRNEGIDIAGAPGAEVRAAGAGTVAAVIEDSDGRPIAVIRHDGNLLTVYSNLAELSVDKGDQVTRGQTIGTLPNSGTPALHFEVRDGIESLDPNSFLGS